MLLAYCVCVYLRVGTVHLYAAVLLLSLTQLFSGWTLLNPPLYPAPFSQIPSSKNPNESRNNGKELFFYTVQYNQCHLTAYNHPPVPGSIHQRSRLCIQVIQPLNFSTLHRSHLPIHKSSQFFVIHSFIHQAFILTCIQAYHPYIHRTILRSMQPCK